MSKNPILVSAATAALLLGLVGCAGGDAGSNGQPTDNGSQPTSSTDTNTNNNTNENPTTPSAPTVDRTTLQWNDVVPADFPLEEIPLPTEGDFRYAELVEEDVWNVLFVDVPKSVHQEWIDKMKTLYNVANDTDSQFRGYAPSGIWYVVWTSVEDQGSTVTVAYRIKLM